jgi:uncharacterized protein DUF6602
MPHLMSPVYRRRITSLEDRLRVQTYRLGARFRALDVSEARACHTWLMSTDFPLRQTLRAIQRKMYADFTDATSQIAHKGAKGREREALAVKQYLEVYMPKTISVVHGAEIIDSEGARSSECDIALLDPGTPPLYAGETFQVVPVEWAYGIIEIKSNLDSAELRDSHRKIVQAKSLSRATYDYNWPGIQLSLHAYGQDYQYFPLYGAVFAFTGISLETLARTLWELQKDTPISTWIDLVVVLDQGLLMYSEPVIATSDALYGRPIPGSVLRVLKSEEAITPATMAMQKIFSHAFMPHAELGPLPARCAWRS